MRRVTRRKQEEESKIDITPMLDVVFIMLIFFIVTASFIKESGVDVTKPGGDTASKRKATIMLAINEKDEIWLDRRKLDPRAVKANINRLRAENPEGEVIVQADQESSAEVLKKVMDALVDAGIPLPVIAIESE